MTFYCNFIVTSMYFSHIDVSYHDTNKEYIIKNIHVGPYNENVRNICTCMAHVYCDNETFKKNKNKKYSPILTYYT